jgi:2-methylisocitrate lyase-like PEP mutase family enzyme
MGTGSLFDLMARDTPVVAPGVYDMISCKLAERARFPAIYVRGYGVSAAHLGLPDVGLMTFTDRLERVQIIAWHSSVPVIADADTGYGGLINLRHTVQGYEAVGVAGIQIEDQEFPKRCAHAQGVRVIDMKSMMRKIEVACESRTTDGCLVIARTDSLAEHGIDDAIRRANSYAEAGADMLFVEGAKTRDQLVQIADSVEAPLLVKMVPDSPTLSTSTEELGRLGYDVVIHPSLAFLAAAAAMESGLSELRNKGRVITAPMMAFDSFSEMIGFDEIYEFDSHWYDASLD